MCLPKMVQNGQTTSLKNRKGARCDVKCVIGSRDMVELHGSEAQAVLGQEMECTEF
jgi:hypothetical protein